MLKKIITYLIEINRNIQTGKPLKKVVFVMPKKFQNFDLFGGGDIPFYLRIIKQVSASFDVDIAFSFPFEHYSLEEYFPENDLKATKEPSLFLIDKGKDIDFDKEDTVYVVYSPSGIVDDVVAKLINKYKNLGFEVLLINEWGNKKGYLEGKPNGHLNFGFNLNEACLGLAPLAEADLDQAARPSKEYFLRSHFGDLGEANLKKIEASDWGWLYVSYESDYDRVLDIISNSKKPKTIFISESELDILRSYFKSKNKLNVYFYENGSIETINSNKDFAINIIVLSDKLEKESFNQLKILASDLGHVARGANTITETIMISKNIGQAWVFMFEPWQDQARLDFVNWLKQNNNGTIIQGENIFDLMIEFYTYEEYPTSKRLIEFIFENGNSDEVKSFFRNLSEKIYQEFGPSKFNGALKEIFENLGFSTIVKP